MEGYIDPLTNCPVIELEVNQRKALCLIDTGFNGFLSTGMNIAETLGIVTPEEREITRLGDHTTTFYHPTTSEILWFGQSKTIPIQVFVTPRTGHIQAVIGTRLLLGYILIVDFNHGHAIIRDPSAGRTSP